MGLSRDDLEELFGTSTVRRALTYQRRGAVHGLRVTPDGDLQATVYGGRRYQTLVWCEEVDEYSLPEVVSACSCPVADCCKHGAAVVLQAQEAAGLRPGGDPARPGTRSGVPSGPAGAGRPRAVPPPPRRRPGRRCCGRSSTRRRPRPTTRPRPRWRSRSGPTGPPTARRR